MNARRSHLMGMVAETREICSPLGRPHCQRVAILDWSLISPSPSLSSLLLPLFPLVFTLAPMHSLQVSPSLSPHFVQSFLLFRDEPIFCCVPSLLTPICRGSGGKAPCRAGREGKKMGDSQAVSKHCANGVGQGSSLCRARKRHQKS